MSENQKKEKIEFAKTSGDDESRPCWRYNFSLGGKELFSLQAVDIKDNKIYYHDQSNNEIPVQFILVPQGENFNRTNLEEYCNKVRGILFKRDGLRGKLDQEFVARILAAQKITDLGLDEALVYAHIFTHTDPKQHKQIRLFDWENIDKGQHGFLKDSLQSNKIKTTLNIQPEEEVYLPMSVHESGKDGLHHISFTTIKINIVGTRIIKSFDTLYGGSLNNENYIPEQHGLKYTMLKSLKQGVSGCGFLTALNAVNYINNGTVDCPSIAGKSIKEIKEILTDSFGYKVDENAIDKDGSIESYPITIYYKNGIKAFEITEGVIKAIQQENKEGTQHGTPPIEHKTITTSFSSFASIGTSSTNDINYNHQPYQSTPQKDNMFSQSL